MAAWLLIDHSARMMVVVMLWKCFSSSLDPLTGYVRTMDRFDAALARPFN